LEIKIKMPSYYVTYPGCENHSYHVDGKIIIKPGVYNGVENPQAYVNRRYMASPLLKSGRIPNISFDKMKFIETCVLDNLKIGRNWYIKRGKPESRESGWIKQPLKKEHFIISDCEESQFVNDVVLLYDYFTKNKHILS
jgi:hypothetical protein